MKRRVFLGTALAGASVLAAPAVLGQGRARVVVIGGGAGGATTARYLAKDAGAQIDVVLIEPNLRYQSCFFSNLHLGGLRSAESLSHGYERLVSAYGVTLMQDSAVAVDRDRREVRLAGGQGVSYDRLVLAPGIDFREDTVPGWSLADAEAMPHAYKGGAQVQLLRAQIEAMAVGGVFCLIAPPNPYRCPPGPYERVSMVAHLLQSINPSAKILVIDPKPGFSKQALFEEGWNRHYRGMIEWVGPEMGGDMVEIRPDSMEVLIDGIPEPVDVCNVIPGQKAGAIVALAGVNDGDWAPVLPDSMRSRIDPNVFVLGDAAQQGDMPKSAFSANSQAKVVAMVIRSELTGARAFGARYSNTCWSAIAPGDGVKIGATYVPGAERIESAEGFISQTGETPERRQTTYEESFGWYDAIAADIFG